MRQDMRDIYLGGRCRGRAALRQRSARRLAWRCPAGRERRGGRGEIVAVLGRNGVGKSTLMKALIGLLALRGGKIVLAAKTLAANRRIGGRNAASDTCRRAARSSHMTVANLRMGRPSIRSGKRR